MSKLVVSLDFELFWGVADSRTVSAYRNNLAGVWEAVPRMLALFRKYEVRVSWATVGMLMCRNYEQWRDIRPSQLPGYLRQECSAYSLHALAREYPRLFFARPLVEQILATPGQELATHTYSHFYCGEAGATPAQFAADLECAQYMGAEVGTRFQSLVFPRNQVRKDFVAELSKAGIQAYRTNRDHWLYRDGHLIPGGLAGRALRLTDAWLPLTGFHGADVVPADDGLVEVPASLFLRPWSRRLALIEPLRLRRMKQAMTSAAISGGNCHLWWHPHNFGVDADQNLAILESLLQHYIKLRDQYGMRTVHMGDLAAEAAA